MRLCDMGEWRLLHQILTMFKVPKMAGLVGMGDDCAVIPWTADESLLVTTDLLLEGVHFLKDHITPNDLGFKAMAVNASDIAAMGGKPRFAFLAMALPSDLECAWIEDFLAGFKELADQHSIP